MDVPEFSLAWREWSAVYWRSFDEVIAYSGKNIERLIGHLENQEPANKSDFGDMRIPHDEESVWRHLSERAYGHCLEFLEEACEQMRLVDDDVLVLTPTEWLEQQGGALALHLEGVMLWVLADVFSYERKETWPTWAEYLQSLFPERDGKNRYAEWLSEFAHSLPVAEEIRPDYEMWRASL